MNHLEYTEENEDFFDYCHIRYDPNSCYINKLRSCSVLTNCFIGKDQAILLRIIGLLRGRVGLNNVVWGYKKRERGKAELELYFYKHSPILTIRNIINTLKPAFHFSSIPVDKTAYFMFSLDVRFPRNKIDSLHVYIGASNPYFPNGSGFCYFLDNCGLKIENYYTFFDPRDEKNKIYKRINESIFYSPSLIKEVFGPFMDCKKMCLANKRDNDAAYFSGVNIHQFIYFIKKYRYPCKIVSFVKNNVKLLDHLQYDISIDFRTSGNKVEIIKSGFYGTF